MKKAILILLTVLLAVSCSQVVYDNLPPVEIGGKYSTTLTATQDGTSAALKLRFNAVPYIAQYGYDINSSDIEEIPDSEIKVIGGANYEFTIPSEDIGNQYNGEIYLYGKVPSDVGTEEWVNIGYTEYSIAIEGTAPVVNLYARNETDAVLYLDSPPAGMMYKVDVKEDSNGDPIEELSVSDLLPDINDGMLHISNLESDQSYIFDVYQKKAGEENEYPTIYSSVEVGPFTNEVKLVLSEEENTGFVVEIAEDLTEISTVKLVNATTGIELATVDVTGNSATFAYDQIPSLEAGLFYAKTTSAGEEYISNYVDTITPITVLEITPNYRSVDLKVKFSDQITDPATDITLSTPGLASSTFEYIEQEDGTYLLGVNGLNSKTSYPNLNLRATVDTNRITIVLDRFSTKSFAGKFFEWKGTFSNGTDKSMQNFIIYVDNAPDDSDYPYYVYFAKNDKTIGQSQNYEKSDYRLMPLIDNSEDLGDNADPKITGYIDWESNYDSAGVSFAMQNATYKKNSEKWNTFPSMHPARWNIGDAICKDDKVQVITNSETSMSFVGIVKTDTQFEFCESSSGEPYVSFYNASDHSFAGPFIAKRGNTEFPVFEEEPGNLNTFWLGLVETINEESVR